MGCSASVDIVNNHKASTDEGKCVLVDRFWEPNIVISEEEKAILKAQWPHFATDRQGHGSAVFLKIFQNFPEMKQVFGIENVDTDSLKHNEIVLNQGLRVMHTIGAAINSIDDQLEEETLSQGLLSLGKLHFYHKRI